jgi:hypothetical protein
MELRSQCFKHSTFSIVSAPSCALSQEIVLRADEKMRSGSALMAGIDKISIAINDNLGQRFLWASWHHH